MAFIKLTKQSTVLGRLKLHARSSSSYTYDHSLLELWFITYSEQNTRMFLTVVLEITLQRKG